MPDQLTSEQDTNGSERNLPTGTQENLAHIKREATILAEAYRLRLVGRYGGQI